MSWDEVPSPKGTRLVVIGIGQGDGSFSGHAGETDFADLSAFFLAELL